MPVDAWLTLLIIFALFVVLLKTRLPPVVVLMGGLTAVMTLGLSPVVDCLSGFANKGVHTVGVLFVVAAGMYSTGAISLVADKVVGLPNRLMQAQLRMLPAVAFASAFLNNTPLVAMMIPVIKDISHRGRVSARRLYMPLSFAAILGGVCTLIGTSSNLVVAGMVSRLLRQGGAALPAMRELSIFDPALVGVPLAAAALAYIIVLSARLLPADPVEQYSGRAARIYRSEFKVPQESSVAGRRLAEIGLSDQPSYSLEAVIRDGVPLEDAGGETTIAGGDELVFHSTLDALAEIWAINGLLPLNEIHPLTSRRYTHSLAQVAISRRAPFVGRKISELPIPGPIYNRSIVGISRKGLPPDSPIREVRIQAGDVLVGEVDNKFYHQEYNDQVFSMIRKLKLARLKRVDRAVCALLITVAMISAAAMGWMSMLNAGLLAAGAMLAFGCIGLKSAGESVRFGTLVTIASAVGIQTAITNSGLSEAAAAVIYRFGGSDPTVALLVIFFGCSLMNTMLTSVATAVFMFPIALALCGQLGVSLTPFAVTLMMGAACSFISPVGYQTNLMVMKPGDYRVVDYVRFGLPLTLICGGLTCLLTPMFFPF